MGHRANFVIIEQNQTKAYYDQWAAVGCVYAFASGPAAAVGSLADMEPTTGLMDWSEAEGGYLLDFDRKTAIVFGTRFEMSDELGEDTDPEIADLEAALETGLQAYLEHIAPAWLGWLLTFDDRGVDAFSAYLQSLAITSITLQPASHPLTTVPPMTLQA